MTDSSHPDDNQCALFIEGALDDVTTDLIARHIARCNDCLDIVGGAVRSLRERVWWQQPVLWATAAAVIIAIIGLGLFRQWRESSAISMIAAAAPQSFRVVEPRLTGFPYARYTVYRGVGNSAETQPDEQERESLRLEAAAAGVLERTEKSSSAAGAHAAGIAYVELRDNPRAIDELTKAAQRNPNDAHIWSDLGAAQIAAGQYAAALAPLGRAVKLDPKLSEVRFNLALAFRDLGRRPQELAAWRAYLALDPNSGWADEARKRIDDLTKTPP